MTVPRIRTAERSDAPVLAHMNNQLVRDMGYDNPMTVAVMEQRMTDWIEADVWYVLVFETETPVGYCVFRFLPDLYHPDETVVFVRQFFISTSHRGHGLGTRCFEQLRDNHFPGGHAVVIHLMERNRRAKSFWRRLGFREQYAVMQLPARYS